MNKIGQNLRLYAAIGVIGIFAVSANPSMAGPLGVSTPEMEKYLVIGTDDLEAFLMSDTELGANQEAVSSSVISPQQRVGGSGLGFPSGSPPNLQDKFFATVRMDAGDPIYVPNQTADLALVPTGLPAGTVAANNRWNDVDPSAEGSSADDVRGTPDTLGIAGDGKADARPLWEPPDWTGNVAITNQTGTVNISNSDVNADLGVQCAQASTLCAPSLSDNRSYFDLNNGPDTREQLGPDGLVDPSSSNIQAGIFGGDDTTHDALLDELGAMKIAIAAATADLIIRDDIEYFSFKDGGTPQVVSDQGSWNDLFSLADEDKGPLIFDLDALDALDGVIDGVVIIDVDRDDSTFKINDSDVILFTEAETIAIFRAIDTDNNGGTNNYDFGNSSIMMGEADWDPTTNPLGLMGDPIRDLGAIFVMDTYGNNNVTHSLDNVILGGIALWDLIDIGGGGGTTTKIHMNNAQGCSQFISNLVHMSNNRWNRCSFAGGEVPEPGTLMIFGLGLAGLFAIRRRRISN